MISEGNYKFKTWQLIGQLNRFMDQNRQVLGANPILFSLILEKQQWDVLITLTTIDTGVGMFSHTTPFKHNYTRQIRYFIAGFIKCQLDDFIVLTIKSGYQYRNCGNISVRMKGCGLKQSGE